MSKPKHHHFVPRFYLRKFTDSNGLLWIFDKLKNTIFSTTPEHIAGQNQFYKLEELSQNGIDPLEMEYQFSNLENETSNIINDWFRQFENRNTLIIPEINRDIISLYVVTQLLRTSEARKQIVEFSKLVTDNYDVEEDQKYLHAGILWDDEFINLMKEKIKDCIWMFGKNTSEKDFCISDHPILVKNQDSTLWELGPRIFDKGMYVVFPLSPKLIMYCKDREVWGQLKLFENSITPIEFNTEMVDHENSGQIAMSDRFIIANKNDFDFTKEFLDENLKFNNPNRKRFEE